jgi:hypothetical protein
MTVDYRGARGREQLPLELWIKSQPSHSPLMAISPLLTIISPSGHIGWSPAES